jgi:hypothetical protein
MQGLVTCRGCSAAIRFARTRKGSRMPVDPAPVQQWMLEGVMGGHRLTLLDATGVLHRGMASFAHSPGAALVTGYVPHFVTCPQAAQFRRVRV